MKFDRYAAVSAEQQRKFMEVYKKEVPDSAEVGKLILQSSLFLEPYFYLLLLNYIR